MALAANALVDYATVKAQLRLSSDTDQVLIEGFINAASGLITAFCNRQLAYAAGIAERKAGFGEPDLLLDVTPVAVLGSITRSSDGYVYPQDSYELMDAGMGQVWNDAGWPWTAQLRPGVTLLTLDQQAGTEKKDYLVRYAGGFITGPMALAAAAWPGASKTIAVGLLCKPTGQPTQLWRATPADAAASLVTSSGEPSWPASPAVGDTLTDGTVVWVYLGTVGSAGQPGTAVSCPADLAQACATEVIARYRSSTRDPTITSESVGAASRTYGGVASEDTGGLCAAAAAMVREYRRTT